MATMMRRRLLRQDEFGEHDYDYWLVSPTKTPPWTRRSRNRRRNKAARASRKANR